MNICIIQARSGSTRLPNKVMKNLYEMKMIEQIVRRCKKIRNIDLIIVATTVNPKDDLIEEWCINNNIQCYRGSETNVLSRFYEISELYSAKNIFRVTADCPFIDYELASTCLSQLIQANTSNLKYAELIKLENNYPRGIFAELFTKSCLDKINKLANLHKHFEHVTLYAYEFPEKFNWLNVEISNRYNCSYRLTIDVKEDLKMITETMKSLKKWDVSTLDVIGFLHDNPNIAKINQHIEQKKI